MLRDNHRIQSLPLTRVQLDQKILKLLKTLHNNRIPLSSSKNNRICWIPDHLIIRNVKACFNSPTPTEDKDDTYIQARFAHSLNLLLQYAVGLSGVRESAVADYKSYPFGM